MLIDEIRPEGPIDNSRDSGNADPETLRLARRHIFSATTRRRSADWDQYDRITAADKRVAMILRPDHIYGPALTRMREALAK